MSSVKRVQPEPIVLRLFDAPENAKRRWTLRQFYERWFRDEHLRRERDVAPGTEAAHEQALDWWERCTDNPALEDASRETLKTLRDKLRVATYARSPKPNARRRPLSKSRQNTILGYVRTMLFYAGPEVDSRRQTAQIIDRPPHIAIPKLQSQPKAGFSVKTARTIAAACKEMRKPRIDGVNAPAWCYALLCAYVFLGQRRGDTLRLRWSMFQLRDRRPWLVLTGDDVEKTGKGTRIFVHPELWQALQAIRTSSEFVFSIDKYKSRPRRKGGKRPWLTGDYVADLMAEMQRLACIPEAQWLSPQAWRRTHLDWLVDAGYHGARTLAQSAADHGDSKTTEGSYVDLENKFRRRLPWLRKELRPAKNARAAGQRTLFEL